MSIILMSCTETFIIETENFESALVVEATITNELKFQNIKLSKTIRLEASEPLLELNAQVKVTDNTNNTYNFSQNAEGIYVSDIAFQAMPNVLYTLEITTSNGKQYVSTPTQLSPVSQIDNLYAELVDDTKKGPGIQVFVDSENVISNANYFRYEYNETHKIVAPHFIPLEEVLSNYIFILTPWGDVNVFFDIEYRDRLQEEEICFSSKQNTEIIQTNTNDLTANTISRFPIRFIGADDSIIRDRYSILVKQYVQSLASYTYYKALDQLSENASILSENQPGFVKGNINAINDPVEKIIGFFDVSSVTERRLFFNYFDFGLLQPDYAYECNVIELDINDNTVLDFDKNDREEIYRRLTRFEEYNQDWTLVKIPFNTSIWKVVRPECGDCTSVGSNIQPDFWED